MKIEAGAPFLCTLPNQFPQAFLLDREADYQLSLGRHAAAERLSRRAEEMREAVQ